MKKIKISGILIGLLMCFDAMAIIPISICMTGKLELTLPTYKTTFLNAVDLALSQKETSRHVRVKTYFFDNEYFPM